MIVYDLVTEKGLKKIFIQVNKHVTFEEHVKHVSSELDPVGIKKAGNWNPPDIEWFRGDGRNIDRYKDPDMNYSGLGKILSPHATELIKPAIEDVAEPATCISKR